MKANETDERRRKKTEEMEANVENQMEVGTTLAIAKLFSRFTFSIRINVVQFSKIHHLEPHLK